MNVRFDKRRGRLLLFLRGVPRENQNPTWDVGRYPGDGPNHVQLRATQMWASSSVNPSQRPRRA
eukprot:8452348-Pyramimonas_sp.AAC.1